MWLAPAIEVVRSKTYQPYHPCPELAEEEIDRLNNLIENAKTDFPVNKAEESDSDSDSSIISNHSQNIDTPPNEQREDSKEDFNQNNYESDFPALHITQPRCRNYGSDCGVLSWQREMYQIQEINHDACVDEDIYEIDQPQHPFQLPRHIRIKLCKVNLCPLPATFEEICMNELDPADAFNLEAKQHHAYHTFVL